LLPYFIAQNQGRKINKKTYKIIDTAENSVLAIADEGSPEKSNGLTVQNIMTAINQSINLLKVKGPDGHLHRSKIHGIQ